MRQIGLVPGTEASTAMPNSVELSFLQAPLDKFGGDVTPIPAVSWTMSVALTAAQTPLLQI